MKKTYFTILIAILLGTITVSAQPYFTRNGTRRPADNRVRNDRYYGGGGYGGYVPYKGFLEIAYAGGVGDIKADQFEILTTHGLQASPNLYVGLGTGLQVHFNDAYTTAQQFDTHTTGVNVPLYVDFRLGTSNYNRFPIQPFFDLKIGASFCLNGDGLAISDGCLARDKNFYLSPSVGFRFPIGYKSGINIAVTYNLTTQNFERNYDYRNIGLSSFGVRLGFDW
ncbi:MAG: hypothetical protein ACI4UL_02865 [Muribaculaceae bacterium]